jgi:hypothetical protein
MYDAFLRGNFDVFVDYTHPKVVELMGGRPKVVAVIQKMLVDEKAQGFVLTGATVGEVRQLTKSGKTGMQVILPTEIVLSGAVVDLRQPSFLLGLSVDNGKTWRFVDTGPIGGEALRKLFPDCSPELKIPPRPKSSVVPKP